MREIRILLPANEIPIGARVSYRNGEHEYRLKDKITAYATYLPSELKPKDKKQLELRGGEGVMFVMRLEDGVIDAIAETTELIWHTTDTELFNWFNTHS